MCGITGWIDWEHNLLNQKPILQQMSDSIRHRGPDAEGYWITEHAALAHRRLIVIDPEGGVQPFIYHESDRLYAMTYNGEIYNYLELRRELIERGHQFKTNSDTEVLLHAYMEWSEDCVKHLNGIFAFAIWDRMKQSLFLARDHLGVKPLFYYQQGSSILFGSEIKAILAHPDVKREVDFQGLSELIALGGIRTPGNGIFTNIFEVKPAHSILFTKERTRETRYWQLQSRSHTETAEETAEHITHLLEDTVKRQLIADVPVVSMLSGGLDSSGLVSIAGRQFFDKGQQLSTYSVDFVGSDQDFVADGARPSLDAPYAKMLSEHVGTKHHVITLTSEQLLENLLIPMRMRDLPGYGDMETSLHLLCKEMKKDATVAISGESADEIFSGYPWFHQEEYLDSSRYPWLLNTWDKFASLLQQDVIESIQPNDYAAMRYAEATREVPLLENETMTQMRQRRMSYLFITRFLIGLLERKDRASMYAGFEVRVPFCDYRLVEYAFNIPFEMKTIGNIEKGILRQAFQGYIPEEVRLRRKSAYPSTQDPVYFAGVQSIFQEMMSNSNAPIHDLLDKKKLMHVVDGSSSLLQGKMHSSQGLLLKLMEYFIQVNMWLSEYRITVKSTNRNLHGFM
ncbi:asparagine synthase (glutamine-hydrolyzing) [Brevibacillus laterosporus]|uniref:asparagine synthase (glutamine-hydrolyzing) n=1 Tax=Brevibacillus laterosporus TaxID=1465 RepID=UPI0018CF280F|nr:asparagine synthase (glutamine-hydrolyzing) [Brevibacillus laterosporus]MBG9799405.1 asparagine synthase [Brevibacillus laterosporus]MCR8936407.1 asparagine synthase (glutamine-hydrolyzing) [Brevibacillus laterosporus]MCZ0839046.1 asparagine synthase (glutamine-hydrolyzing) [Brevibacillus laterosporus]MCZ0846990.1 asparagine synthase (glutamine-hydrolyzing) [Brevibacillus laterosporus]MED1910272.1 asparagine synthase (glutamine-hydrolyzing) [Brevibacillus laterosporus]